MRGRRRGRGRAGRGRVSFERVEQLQDVVAVRAARGWASRRAGRRTQGGRRERVSEGGAAGARERATDRLVELRGGGDVMAPSGSLCL